MEKPSVIICHHKGNLIERCLKSLENIEVESIVVTSNESWQPYRDIEVHPHKDYKCNLTLFVQNNNPAFKRNVGSKRAKGQYLCFMDDDIEVKYDCIEQMEDYLDNHKDVGMVYGLLYKMDNHNKIDTSGSYLTWCGFLYETYINRINSIPILSGKSALCMIRKDLFNKIDRFDEDFVIYGEETDLSWRVWLAGYKVMVLPSAIGYHAFETVLKPKSYYNQEYIHYHGCKNYITMLIKNLPARKLYIVFINVSIWFIIGFCLWFRNRQGAKWIMQGIWYNIRNLPYIWKKRKHPQNISYIWKNPPIWYYFGRFMDYLIHSLHGGITKKSKS